MFAQHKYTVVIVSFDSVGRVDLSFDQADESSHVVKAWRTERPEHADLTQAVGAGLALGPKQYDRVYVLTNEVWSGQISVSDQVVNAVTSDQLEQTLALEAEFESGISPFDSRLGYVLTATVAEGNTWWVTQAESNQLQAIECAVQNGAGILCGVSSMAVCMPNSNDGNEEYADTQTTDECENLAQEWLTKYLVDNSALPVIRMTRPSWADQNQRLISAIVAVLALVSCMAFHASGMRQIKHANAGLSTLIQQETHLRQTLDDAEKHARQASAAKVQREAADQAQAKHIAQTRQWEIEREAKKQRAVQLLRALLSSTSEDHCVLSIQLNSEQAMIIGVAIESTSVTTLSQSIESALDSSKWLFKRAKIMMAEANSLVHYEITLVPRDITSRLSTVSKHVSR